MDTNEYKKSFDLISEAVQKGLLDDPFLIKAREQYEELTNWKADKITLLAKAKTFSQFLNGEELDSELVKALQEGQTKMKNGILYVVKKTKSGKLDWRKANKQKKKAVVDDDPDFPKDLSKLKVIKRLGGSTGAQLVEDPDTGDQYVMKQGNSPAHIEEEYLANKLYEAFGVNVPLVKLYNEGTKDATMLSEFMPNTDVANNILDDRIKGEIMQNYVVDCLMGNWDIYKNDNILINKDDGLVYRVDNGGSLRFSATGRDKGDDFTDEVDELDSMIGNNMQMTNGITQDDLEVQIKRVMKSEKAVLKLIKDKDLKLKMEKRFFDLKMRLDDFDVSGLDPYRDLEEKDLKKALKKAGGHITNRNSETGWSFLSEICKMRGFDKQPEVLDDKEFDKLLADKNSTMIQRGVTGSGGHNAQYYMKQFAYGKDCFYGTVGMYGAGIYAAVNKTKKNPPPPNPDYQIAYDYAGYDENGITDIIIPPDANVVDAKDLDQMMYDEFFGPEFAEKKKDYDKARKDWEEAEDKAQNIEKIIEDETREEMGWNEKVLNALNSKAEIHYADPEVHSFNKVLRYYTALTNQLGGKVTKINDSTHEISLPNSSDTFTFDSGVAGRSVKQKNEFSDPYNLHYKYFKQFVMDNHYKKINEAIKDIQKDDDRIAQAHQDAKDAKKKLSDISDEINKIKASGSGVIGEVLGEIAKRPNGEYRGFYAAIKGYDAIIQKNGWGGKTDFAIVLNRSKMKVRKFM